MTKVAAALRWFFERSALLTFFALFLLGLIMLIFSIVAGVGFFEFQTPAGQSKQVGYIWALNWSFMFLLGFPIMFFFILETSDSLRRTLERLVEDGMIVDMNWHPAGVGALDDERNRFWRLSACAAIFVTICIVPYCLIEWYIVSGRHLFANQLPAVVLQGPHWLEEIDWSVAALLPGPDRTGATQGSGISTPRSASSTT